LREKDVLPVPAELFIEYADWFRHQYNLEVRRSFVKDLTRHDGLFEASLTNGNIIIADNVVAAPGVRDFANLPKGISQQLSPGCYSHTAQFTDFDLVAGRRYLIIGGGQSAFEWAALMCEDGKAEKIHIVYRHDPPALRSANHDFWASVEEMMDLTLSVRGWFRRLSSADREALMQQFSVEGRRRLEPWLAARITRGSIKQWAKTRLAACKERPNGEIEVILSCGDRIVVDHIICATGYRVDIRKLSYMRTLTRAGPASLSLSGGYPVLDNYFQSAIPGLFLSGITAVRDFGPFFRFLRGSTVAAQLIVSRLAKDFDGRN
jgi:lysine/ornithine N-monooxygenase